MSRGGLVVVGIALGASVGCGRCAGAPAPKPPPDHAWSTTPVAGSMFSSMIEGRCSRLRVSALDGAILIHDEKLVARVTPEGFVDAETRSNGAENIAWIGGRFPENAWLHHSEAGWLGDRPRRWSGSEWVDVWPPQDGGPPHYRRFATTPNGAVLVELFDPNTSPFRAGTLVGFPTPIESGRVVFPTTVEDMAARPSGEILFAVRRDRLEQRGAVDVRHLEAGRITTRPLPRGADSMRLFAGAKNAFAYDEQDASYLASLEGDVWTRVAAPPFKVSAVHEAPDGAAWFLGEGKLARRAPDGSFTLVGPRGKVTRVAGIELGTPWAIANEALLRWEPGDTWTPVELPTASQRPGIALVPRYVVVASGGVIYVEARGANYTSDPIYALLRNGPPAKTVLRCEDGAFFDWPPLADAGCATPFAVLGSDRSLLLPGVREALGAELVEVHTPRHVYVGARVRGFDAGVSMLETVPGGLDMKADRAVVCGVPPTR